MQRRILPKKFLPDKIGEIYIRLYITLYPKKVCTLVVSFSALDRWSKKRRGEALLQKETQCMLMIDELFDVLW